MVDYDQLVGSIYDCAANPELWPEALGHVRDAVGGAYALIGHFDKSELALGRPPVFYRRNSAWDEDSLIQLETLINSMPDGGGMFEGLDAAWTQLSRLPEAVFQTTEFYKGWVQPQGLRDTINVPYLHRANMTGMLSIPSYASREPYGDVEVQLIERVTPHIRRAMLINDMADKGKMATQLYRQVLDSLSVGVFVVGLGRRVIFTNAAGDGLLSEGRLLKLANGMLQANRVEGLSSALDEAIDRALKGDMAIGITGIGVPLIGNDGSRAAAYVLPSAGHDVRGECGSGNCMVFVARRGEQQPVAIEVLRTLFNLTAAEARVAALLAQGNNPQNISTALDISVNTVRTHLKHIFAKTQTHDQTALSGLVNGLLPPLTVE